MNVDPHLVADPHWRTLAAALHDAHVRRVDVPDAITVALQDGPLNPDAPAADLTSRLARLTEPEPFARGPAEQLSAPQHDPQANELPSRDRSSATW